MGATEVVHANAPATKDVATTDVTTGAATTEASTALPLVLADGAMTGTTTSARRLMVAMVEAPRVYAIHARTLRSVTAVTALADSAMHARPVVRTTLLPPAPDGTPPGPAHAAPRGARACGSGLHARPQPGESTKVFSPNRGCPDRHGIEAPPQQGESPGAPPPFRESTATASQEEYSLGPRGI